MSMMILEDLECHFTWALDFGHAIHEIRQHLEDINPQEGNPWLGCIHNLLGFINFRLKANKDALESFQTAAEAFSAADEGPRLVVTYGNLAWLHHHLGNREESQKYLTRVGDLMKTHPPPSQDELHPEVYAEKAWTLMSDPVHNPLVGEYFLRAIKRRPDMVAWNSSYVAWLFQPVKKKLEVDLIETLRSAREQDPENSYLAVLDLNQRAMRGENIEEEARMLADQIMEAPLSEYSGMKTLFWTFTKHISAEEAMNLAEQLLERHPDQHYAKKCAAQCYRQSLDADNFKVQKESLQDNRIRNRAIELHEDLIQHYPESSATTKLHLAGMCASVDQGRSEELYEDLLGKPNAADKQELYYKYANFLFYQKKEAESSARYLMKVLKIPQQSKYYERSYNILDRNRKKNRYRRVGLEQFMMTVPRPENQPGPQRDDRL